MSSSKLPSHGRLHEDELVAPPRATRKAALLVFFVVLVLPVVVLIAPWRQNVAARGRVTALNPTDRVQEIPAPVTGRIVKSHVREGDHVEEGQILLEMTDLDPTLSLRLQQQVELAREKVRAARESATLLESQNENLRDSRGFAVNVVEAELRVAKEKVTAAKQGEQAARAEYAQKKADLERKRSLFGRKLTSELTLQKAEAAAEAAVAKRTKAEADREIALREVEAKQASLEKTRTELQAKLEAAASKLAEAKGKVAGFEKELRDAESKLARQSTQRVLAPRSGVILSLEGVGQAHLLKKGERLLRYVPDTDELAVELWLSGNDAPLVTPGRSVRLQFEGWPAVQFVGWPSAARGTFGGEVRIVDAHDDGKGRFRILVTPDESDGEWPERRYLRQGVQVKGWVLLEEVSVGFEIWRQLNGFPPSLDEAPGTSKKKKKGK